ncbi:hypothetical protein D3C78_1720350 [compost metagenome]
MNNVGLVFCTCFYVLARREVSALVPFGIPARFQFGGFEALGEFRGVARGIRGVRGSSLSHYRVPADRAPGVGIRAANRSF